MNHLLSLEGFTPGKISSLIRLGKAMKKAPLGHSSKLRGKTLLSIFEKPSFRTRISFELAMLQLGGHAITIDSQATPMCGKESIEDTAKVAGRYVDVIMARLYSHEKLTKLAQNSQVPVINGLTDKYHPCQVLSDLLTITEKKGKLKGLKLAYFGDADNNVTHCLILGCALMGIDISVACPAGHEPQPGVMEMAKDASAGSKTEVMRDAAAAAKGADIIYTDSWMSYHVSESEKEARIKAFAPYRVTAGVLGLAKKDAIFMNCLPAQRGMEQTAEVIDGPQSVVFDQAENRLHMQKAILLYAMGLA
ncbi:MAG: ornithine carbamoyltransferase [Candidatus Diapherotrites archaeon]|uniref:Ornithine carbamoyltransferase n=1 Tax=Candidatus Iainarchaeum sp. TaxID=3101447 RepID=A0A8T3YKP0_9ARCH|nr:ornithine carbamoyltransferase [Candidatus Diapherotrites archaeon]